MTPSTTLADLHARLRAEGLDPGDPDAWRAALPSGPGTPWFVRVLVGGGAWVAGVLLAVGISFFLALGRSEAAMLLVGLAVCAGSAWLRAASRGDFTAQFALSLGLAGQAMAGVGLLMVAGHGDRWTLFLAGMAALQVVLLVGFRDPVQRFLSAFAVGLLLTLILERHRLGFLEAAFLGLGLLAWGVLPVRLWRGPGLALRRPVGYALGVLFLGLYTWHAVERMLLHHGSSSRLWASGFHDLPAWVLGGLAPGLLLAAVALPILLRLGRGTDSRAGAAVLATVLALALLGVRTPGIPAVLFVLVLALESRESVLAGLAVAAGLVHLTQLYYLLDLGLLAKSGLLVASGAVLLALRATLRGESA